MLKKLTLVSACLIALTSFAQFSYSGGYCGTPSFEEQTQSRKDLSDSEKEQLLEEHRVLEQQISKRADEIYAQRGHKSGTVYVIPVVFHIFHKNGPENISEAQVRDCLRIMNEEFNASNAKLSQVIPEFQPIIGDVEVEFRLATKDPSGNCTNGINRYYNPNTYYTSQAPIQTLKTQYIWPSNKYLNCFIVGSIESSGGGRTLGYAQFPGGNANTDGLVMVHDGIGSIGTGNSQNQSVATHEIGHWLGLSHTWGNCAAAGDVAACGCDDNISDTPNTKGSPSVCNLDEASCGSKANVQNFMDYSFCYAMFTQGQAARMRSILETVNSRKNLWQSANLIATGADYDPANIPNPLCKADFIPSTYETVCGGNVVTFTDYSYGSVSSWSWSFPGGTPSTSTDRNPSVTYSSAGNFDVSLTVSDGTNSVSTTKTALVKVIPSNALPIPYVQKFGSISNLAPDFEVENPNSDRTWQLYSGAGVDDNKSVYIQARSISGSGKIDNLITNTLDLSQLSSPVLRLKYAYARKSSSSVDELNIYVSTDCGLTWLKRKVLKGSTLKTGNDTPTGDFVPTTSEWKSTEISLANFKAEGFRAKLEWITNAGNNIYIDDFMIGESTVGIDETNLNNLDLAVYPNPMESAAKIQFELISGSQVEFSLLNLLGQKVQSLEAKYFEPGKHEVSFNRGQLNAGVYFLDVKLGESRTSYKLIVQ